MSNVEEDGLVDYGPEEEIETEQHDKKETKKEEEKTKEVKKGYVGIHSSGFRDFLLKPELLRAVVDCGFEHPSI